MKRMALSLALCALTAGVAVGQVASIEVATSDGAVLLPVTIIAGAGEGVALAAGDESPEHEGVMALPIPGSGYALRTECSESACDVTWMHRVDTASAKSPFADALCTSRWNAGEKGEHCLVSALAEGESVGEWSRRHAEGLLAIGTIYPVVGASRDATPDGAIESSSRDRAMTEWIDAQGVRHAVFTKQRGDEQRDAWLLRHRAAVQAFAAVLQPVG